jgi:hypothetical protein
VETEEQRAKGRDEEDVDEVAREAIEPRSRAHGADCDSEMCGAVEAEGREMSMWQHCRC